MRRDFTTHIGLPQKEDYVTSCHYELLTAAEFSGREVS